MEESQDEEYLKKPTRERPKSAMISKSDTTDFPIRKSLRQSEIEEKKNSKISPSLSIKINKKSPKVILEAVLKKKNRFGLFFKKKLILTSDHKLYYTDKKES
jgi:hypothetical protein